MLDDEWGDTILIHCFLSLSLSSYSLSSYSLSSFSLSLSLSLSLHVRIDFSIRNRYVILSKDFEKGYKNNVKKQDSNFEFYR